MTGDRFTGRAEGKEEFFVFFPIKIPSVLPFFL
jgi:hypothetical protein